MDFENLNRLPEFGFSRGVSVSHLQVSAIAPSCQNPKQLGAKFANRRSSMRLDLMLALRVVLSRSRFITMWRTMARLLAA